MLLLVNWLFHLARLHGARLVFNIASKEYQRMDKVTLSWHYSGGGAFRRGKQLKLFLGNDAALFITRINTR